jgi:hypothetical protein
VEVVAAASQQQQQQQQQQWQTYAEQEVEPTALPSDRVDGLDVPAAHSHGQNINWPSNLSWHVHAELS